MVAKQLIKRLTSVLFIKIEVDEAHILYGHRSVLRFMRKNASVQPVPGSSSCRLYGVRHPSYQCD